MKCNVEGEFDITVDDLRRAAREMPETRFVRWMPPLVILPGFAIGVWGSGKTNEFFVYFMICLAIAIAIALSGWKSAARRELENIRPEARHVRFRLDDHGVEFETTGATSKHDYTALYGFVEGRHLFLLYTQPEQAQLIPRPPVESSVANTVTPSRSVRDSLTSRAAPASR